MHSTLYNWYLPAGRLPPPGSSSPSFVVRKHFGRGGFEGRVWWPLRCLLCHNFPHLHLHKKKNSVSYIKTKTFVCQVNSGWWSYQSLLALIARQRRISLQECQQRCGLHEIQLHGHRGTPLIRVDCSMPFRRVQESRSLRFTVHVCAFHSQHINCTPEFVCIWRHRCPKIPAVPDAHFRRHRHEWSPHESSQTQLSEPDRGQIPTIKNAPPV